ncbi:MAG: expansin EXLX1 family cellulose-binding protein [Candidatus Thiodiazotropha sp.]
MNKSSQLGTALLLTVGASLSLADGSEHRGEATFYGYGGGGNCSFPLPTGILTAAMNASDYDNSSACGGVIVVTNEDTGLSVTVRIDDQCPECAPGDVDLDQDAFAQIADIATGRIPIRWHYLANDQAGSVKLVFKEGSSQWWTGVQVRDHLYPISRLEYRQTGSGDGYQQVSRQPYNYFVEASGFGAGPYDFKITDFWGQSIEVSGVALTLGSEINTGHQFPVHASDGGEDSAEDNNSEEEDEDGQSLNQAETTLSLINSWESGYCANVSVSNPNSGPLNWAVTLDVGGTVSSVWNAEWSQNGSTLMASGASWNATLAAGGTTDFGFCTAY